MGGGIECGSNEGGQPAIGERGVVGPDPRSLHTPELQRVGGWEARAGGHPVSPEPGCRAPGSAQARALGPPTSPHGQQQQRAGSPDGAGHQVHGLLLRQVVLVPRLKHRHGVQAARNSATNRERRVGDQQRQQPLCPASNAVMAFRLRAVGGARKPGTASGAAAAAACGQPHRTQRIQPARPALCTRPHPPRTPAAHLPEPCSRAARSTPPPLTTPPRGNAVRQQQHGPPTCRSPWCSRAASRWSRAGRR